MPIREGGKDCRGVIYTQKDVIYILKQMGRERGKAGQEHSECLAEEVGLSLNPWGKTVQVSCWDC